MAILLGGLTLGGCQINAIDLARVLRDRGHEVRLYAVEDDVKVSVLPYAAAAGFEVTVVPAHGSLLPQTRELRRHLGGGRHDVVHAFAPWLGPATTLVCGPWRRTSPVVLNWTTEDMPHTGPHTPLVLGTERLCAETRARHRAPVWLLEPPVDTDKDRPDPVAGRRFREEHGLAPDAVVIALVGRVDRVMKLPGIVAAADAVARLDHERVRLLVVGDGDAMAEAADRVRQVNDALGRKAVLLTGALIDPHPAYAAADVGLGMGGSALRALAHGLPVVVLGNRGFATTVSPETEEYFLREGFFGQDEVSDPAAHLAGQLRPLLDPARRAELSGYGLELVGGRFSLDSGADRLEEIYAETVTGSPGTVVRLVDAVRLVARDLARRAWCATWRARRSP